MRPAEDQATVESTGTPVTYSGETAGDVDGEAVLLMPSPRDSIASLEQSPFWESNLKPRVVWLSDAKERRSTMPVYSERRGCREIWAPR